MYPIAIMIAMIIVFITGFRLKAAGRPYGPVLLNVHKLVDLAAVATVGVLIYGAGSEQGFSAGVWVVIGVGVLLVVAMFASGGMLSAMAEPPAWVLLMHKAVPWMAVGLAMLMVLLVLTGIIAEPETVIESLIESVR